MSEAVPIYKVSIDETRALLEQVIDDLDNPKWLGMVTVSICEDEADHNVCLYVCSPKGKLSSLEVRGALDFAKGQIAGLASWR